MEEFGAEVWDGDRLVTTALVQLHAAHGGVASNRDGTFYLIHASDIEVEKAYRLVADDGRSGTITVTALTERTGPPALVVFQLRGSFAR